MNILVRSSNTKADCCFISATVIIIIIKITIYLFVLAGTNLRDTLSDMLHQII
jgi:hypothetical protein